MLYDDRQMSKVVALVGVILIVVCPCVAEGQVSAWLVDSLIKIFPDSPPVSSTVPFSAVPSARNGHASLQVVLRANSRQDMTVKVAAPRLNKTSLETQLFRVGYVRVASHPKDVPLDEVVRPEVGPYPDPLYPLSGPLKLESAKTESVWISIYTPDGSPPGIYRGVVEIRSGKTNIKLPFRIEVFAASVPKEQKLWVTNWLWFDRDTIAKHYPSTRLHPERYWTVMENTTKTMAAYKQNVGFIPVRSLAKAHLIDGKIQYDFSEFDHWVDVFDKAGTAKMIEGGHLSARAGGGFDAPYVLPADLIENGQVIRKELPSSDPRTEENLRVFLRQLRQHLKEKGWLNRYAQHIHDEPHGAEMPIYKRFASIVHEEMPGVPTVDAIDLKDDIPSVESTTIWVPILSSFDEKLDLIRQHEALGGQGWYYICLHPRGRYLNRFIDYPLLKVRLLPWLNFRYGLTGYLHWGGNYWTDDPINDLQPNWGGDVFLPAGDDAIVYPDAEHDGVFVSTRLEMMREGIEEYEVLRELELHRPGAASKLAQTVIPGFTDYVRDVRQFRDYQRQLLTGAAQPHPAGATAVPAVESSPRGVSSSHPEGFVDSVRF